MWYLLLAIIIVAHGLTINEVFASEKSVREMKGMLPPKVGEYRSEGKDQFYDRNSTFRYMNGAAELYRSYAFKMLMVRHYIKRDHPPVVVELFDMDLPEDAFGVFSFETEGEEVGIGQGSEYAGGLLRFWKSKFFINSYAEKETTSMKQDILEIGRAISESIRGEGRKPKLLEYTPQGFEERRVRYFHHSHNLNHHYFISHENILQLGKGTNALLASYSFPQIKGRTYLLLIQYPTAKLAAEAHKSFVRAYMPEASASKVVRTENGKWAAAQSKKEYVVVVLDAPSQEKADGLISVTQKRIEER